jgi:hypothetical protein
MTEWDSPAIDGSPAIDRALELLTEEMRKRSKFWAKWPDRYTAKGTIASWRGAVQRLSLSNNHMSDEYLHDLDKRRSVHRLMNVAHELGLNELLDWMITIVDATDDRFREITTPDTDGIMKHRDRQVPEYWWYRRLTTNPYTLKQFQDIDDASRARPNAPEEPA